MDSGTMSRQVFYLVEPSQKELYIKKNYTVFKYSVNGFSIQLFPTSDLLQIKFTLRLTRGRNNDSLKRPEVKSQ